MVRLNFTDTEKYGNSSLGLDPLPSGKYHVAITDVDVRFSGPAAKNPGSEYWAIEMTVQSGEYQGRKVWTNASMLPHALYTIKGILEALGAETTGNELNVEPDDILNKELVVRTQLKKGGEKYLDAQGQEKETSERAEVKGFFKLEGAKTGATSGGSLLP
jgi:hypothetical protein